MRNSSSFILFIIAFLNALGIALVYPLFSTILFQPSWHFVDPCTSENIRGFWLGLLLSIMPLIQMIVSPYFGSLSDKVGRRPIILATLSCAILGYFIGTISILHQSLAELLLSRILLGISASSYAAIYAIITDSCSTEQKRQYFAQMSMVYGFGFTIGPIVGALVAGKTAFWAENFARPFILSGALAFCSTVAAFIWLSETCTTKNKCDAKQSSFLNDLLNINISTSYVLISIFLFSFGWTYYSEMIPVLWVTQFKMSPTQVGQFFTYGAVWYTIFCKFILPYAMKRWSHLKIFEIACFSLACFIWCVFFFKKQEAYWITIPLQNLALACFFPISATVLSEMAPKNQQGKIMGLHFSAESLGIGIGPLISGSLLGFYLFLPIILGGFAALCAGIILRHVRRSCLSKRY